MHALPADYSPAETELASDASYCAMMLFEIQMIRTLLTDFGEDAGLEPMSRCCILSSVFCILSSVFCILYLYVYSVFCILCSVFRT